MKTLPLGISLSCYQPEDVDAFVRAGFQYFEVSLPGRLGNRGEEEKYAGAARRYTDKMRPYGIKPWSFHLPFARHWDISEEDEAVWRGIVDALKLLMLLLRDEGYRVFVVHGCGAEPITPENRAARLDHATRALQALSECARSMGACLAVENLPRTCIGNSSAELYRLTDGKLPVCFDVNHLLCETHDQFMDRLEKQIVTTHLSDYDGLDEKHWLPGRGVVDWRHVIGRLEAAGFEGPYLFELGLNGDRPYTPEEIRLAFGRLLEEK